MADTAQWIEAILDRCAAIERDVRKYSMVPEHAYAIRHPLTQLEAAIAGKDRGLMQARDYTLKLERALRKAREEVGPLVSLLAEKDRKIARLEQSLDSKDRALSRFRIA